MARKLNQHPEEVQKKSYYNHFFLSLLKYISAKSIVLVTIQTICVIFILSTGKIIPDNYLLLILLFLFSIPAIWAILLMNKFLNISPEIMPGAKLIISGPYKFIRHPMYCSLVLISLIWIIDTFTYTRLTIWMVLLINILIKLFYEEKILYNNFPEYSEYQKKTKRFIPFIF